MIRVGLPTHLRHLAGVGGEVTLDLPGQDAVPDVVPDAAPETVTLGMVLGALEDRYPVLRGTIRDQASGKRRAFVRFFACQQDLSHEPADTALPTAVTSGAEPLLIVGAMAGG
jgi:sulfur-carrier protein